MLNFHNKVSYGILLLKTLAKDFSINCHVKHYFILTDYIPPVREQRRSSTRTSYYETRTASRTRQTVGSKTQHIALDSKGNPAFVNKSGNTIIIVKYPFVMMLYSLKYLKYFSLSIQLTEEYHEVSQGQEEVLEDFPVVEGYHNVPESKCAVKQIQRKTCYLIRIGCLISCHVKCSCINFNKCNLH